MNNYSISISVSDGTLGNDLKSKIADAIAAFCLLNKDVEISMNSNSNSNQQFGKIPTQPTPFI